MQEAEERYLKFTAEKAFRVIGFVDADQAPRHQFMAVSDPSSLSFPLLLSSTMPLFGL